MRLLHLSEHPGLTLVFVETKRNADMLEHRLCDCGYASADLVPALTGRCPREIYPARADAA